MGGVRNDTNNWHDVLDVASHPKELRGMAMQPPGVAVRWVRVPGVDHSRR
jgi:hypothetical protein